MKCPKCQFENPDGVNFCVECGAKLEKICPECGYSNSLSHKFCGGCGHKLSLPTETIPKDLSFDEKLSKIQRYLPKGLTEKILSQRDRIEGERKHVTVMFCDMERFTRLSEKLGPEEAYTAMDQVYEILICKVHDYEGTVNEFTGDGIMAMFGAPIALEDAPQRAIRSAYAIHREMARFSDKMKQEKENIPSLKMRIGIHTGPVVVGTLGNDLRVEFKAVGDTVNLASRMEGLAEPGATFVTESTFKLTEGFFRFEALGEMEIKGKEEPINVYRVIAPSTRRTRFDVSAERGLTPFVGRERELEILLDAFERVKAGRGQAVSIVSEAGVGKSRLLYEFRKAVANEDATFLEGKCLSYRRGVAYHPVIDILKSNFDTLDGDGDAEIREKVRNGLRVLDADEATTLPYLLDLLSVKDSGINEILLSPEARKERITEALKRIVLKGSAIRSLIMAFEDLHWIDESSEDAVRYLLQSIFGARVLLIFTYRPEFVHSWGGKSYHSQVNLNRLSNKESLKMTSYLLNTENIDRALEDFILEKTEGVPFFIEEFIRSFKDLAIIEKKDNTYQLAKDILDVTIPSTIHDVIMSRVDSLPDGAKDVLQTGSVIGREFGYELIKQVMDLSEKEVLTNLSILKDSELLYERGIHPQSTYIFKHALNQEVVCSTLVKQRRREKHGRIAREMEKLYAYRLEDYYEMLSYHYEQGGDTEKAVHYLVLAGEKSNKQHAVRAASDFFAKALELSENSNLALDAETTIRLHSGQARASLNIGDILTAIERHRKVFRLSQLHGMTRYERKSLTALAYMTYMFTTKSEAQKILKEVMDWARNNEDKALESIVLSSKGFVEASYAEIYNGNQILLDAERIAKETGKSLPISAACIIRSFTERWLGRPLKTIELTEGMVETMLNMHALTNLPNVIIPRGIALAEIGRIEEGMRIIRIGIDICEKMGANFRLGALCNCLGYCYSEIHQHRYAWEFNLKSQEIASKLWEEYPMACLPYAEILAQASVNLMENLFDQGKYDEAWKRLNSFAEASRSNDYDLRRLQWQSRMNYLAAQILLVRNEIDKAEKVILENLEMTQQKRMRKREGCFLRLLGEIQIKRNEFDNAFSNLRKAIHILKEVSNYRQLWQTYSAIASAYNKLRRFSEAKENWGSAAELIKTVANGLSDHKLKSDFLNIEPVKKILSNSGS